MVKEKEENATLEIDNSHGTLTNELSMIQFTF